MAEAGFMKGSQVEWAAKPVQKHNGVLRETTTYAIESEYAPNEMPRRAPPLERRTEQRRKSERAKNCATPFGLEKSRNPRVVNAAAARSGYMDTITTIQSLLQSNGSARPVMVSLTPSEHRLIAAAPDLFEALKGIVDDDDAGVSLADQRARSDARMAAAKAALLKATGA